MNVNELAGNGRDLELVGGEAGSGVDGSWLNKSNDETCGRDGIDDRMGVDCSFKRFVGRSKSKEMANQFRCIGVRLLTLGGQRSRRAVNHLRR